MCRSAGISPFVGSKSIQPPIGVHTEHHARGVGTDQTLLARRRGGLDVAAHVPPRQPDRPQAADRQMGEVLAHTAARCEHAPQRRRHVREAGVEPERLIDVQAQRANRGDDRAPGVNERAAMLRNDTEVGEIDEGRRRPEEPGVPRQVPPCRVELRHHLSREVSSSGR